MKYCALPETLRDQYHLVDELFEDDNLEFSYCELPSGGRMYRIEDEVLEHLTILQNVGPPGFDVVDLEINGTKPVAFMVLNDGMLFMYAGQPADTLVWVDGTL